MLTIRKTIIAAIGLLLPIIVLFSGITAYAQFNPTQVPWGIDRTTGMLCVDTAASPPGCQTRIGTAGLRYAQITDLLCVADQSANLQSEATAAGAGAALILPAGCIRFGAGTVTLPLGQVWVGQGGIGAGGSGTLLFSAQASGTGIILPGSGSALFNMAFANNGGANTQVAVQMGTGSQPRQQSIQNCAFEGFGTQVYIYDAIYTQIFNNIFDGSYVYGMRIRNVSHFDNGETMITGSTFGSNPTAIRYESGGGLKITNSKIITGAVVNGQYGVDLAVEDGAVTGDFTTSSLSIEGTTVAGVYLHRAGTTGTFANITINAQIAADTGAAVKIDTGISNVTIPATSILQSPAAGGHAIEIDGGSRINVAPVVTFSDQSAVYVTGGTGINVDTRNFYGIVNGKLYEDTRAANAFVDETQTKEYTRVISNLTSSVSYTTLFTIQPPVFSGISLELSFEGIITGVGGGQVSGKWSVYRNTNSVAANVWTVQNGGSLPPFDINLDTSSGTGLILVQAKLHSATGTALNGQVTAKITGPLAQFAYTP